MVSEKKSLLKRILIIIITVIIAFSAISMVATKIIYDNIFARYDQTVQISPKLSHMVTGREQHTFFSGQNRLNGFLYHTDKKASNGLIVMATGFNASSDDYLWQIKSFLDYGWSVFIFDATGSCYSKGDSTVGFSQILLDLEQTIKYVEKNNRFGYNKLVLFGHSRGGYAACCALSYQYDISAVVSVSGINSAMEGVVGSAANHIGAIAYGNYGYLWIYQALLFGKETVELEAVEEISESDVPVLVVHGNNDSTVPKDKYSIISHKGDIDSDNVEYILCTTPGQDGHTDLLFDADGTANDSLMSDINEFLIKNVK